MTFKHSITTKWCIRNCESYKALASWNYMLDFFLNIKMWFLESKSLIFNWEKRTDDNRIPLKGESFLGPQTSHHKVCFIRTFGLLKLCEILNC